MRLATAAMPGGLVTGIDPSESMIDYCSRKAGVETRFEVGTAQELPFDDGTFDVVASSMAIHHIPPGTRPASVGEMYRVLRPGGNVEQSDPVRALRGLVADSGFTSKATGRHPLVHHIAARRSAN